MSNLPPKPKKPQLIPIPLILAVLFVVFLIVWGQLTSVPGQKLTILHTNDLQGQLIPITEEVNGKNVEVAGFARIASKVAEIREKDKNVLLLDAGDTIQGTLFTRIYGGEPFGQLMSKLGYDAVTIGEHDFDKGPEGLKDYIKSASYRFLVANIDISKSKILTDKDIKPYDVIDINGIKVGIFGLATPDANVFAKIGTDIVVTDPKEAARKAVDELQPKSDIIIALTHLGLKDDRLLATSVPGIDIIVGGGSKTKLSVPVITNNKAGNKTIIVQAKNQGRYLGKLDLAVKDKNVKVLDYELITIDTSITPDVEFSAIITHLNKQLEKDKEKPVGSTNVELDGLKSHLRTGETNLGNIFADAVKETFPESDIVFQNAGGIRADEIFPPGKISEATIWEWHPFENKIVLVTLKGKQIKEVLERGASNLPISKGSFLQVSGLNYTIDLTGTPQVLTEDNSAIKFEGDRVIDVTVNGKPLNYNKEYRVAINDFLANRGDGFVTFANGKDIVYTNLTLTDAVKEYIEKHSPLNAQKEGRIEVKGGLLK
ncbi:MAG: 5'-nucleotidase C-terminal domain-containing protein [Cyanobacteriota bacterium]